MDLTWRVKETKEVPMTHTPVQLAYGLVKADNKTNLVAHTPVLWIKEPSCGIKRPPGGNKAVLVGYIHVMVGYRH